MKYQIEENKLYSMIGECVQEVKKEYKDQQLNEAIVRNTRAVIREMLEDGGSQYKTEVKSSFTGKTRAGQPIKYQIWVRIEESVVNTTIAIRSEKGWDPEVDFEVDVEEYGDGSWLPYWESLGGVGGIKRYWPVIKKAWIKIGYQAEEDGYECPFNTGM